MTQATRGEICISNQQPPAAPQQALIASISILPRKTRILD